MNPFNIMELLAPIPATLRQRQSTPWTGRQYVTGLDIYVGLWEETAVLWEDPEIQGFEPELSHCEIRVLTTTSPAQYTVFYP